MLAVGAYSSGAYWQFVVLGLGLIRLGAFLIGGGEEAIKGSMGKRKHSIRKSDTPHSINVGR